MKFGTELALSWQCLTKAELITNLSIFDNDLSHCAPLKRILVQPSFESVEWLFRRKWDDNLWTIADFEQLATLLSGVVTKVRNSDATITNASNIVLRFDYSDKLDEQLQEIITRVN